jgi:hypothetical protein
MRSLAFASLPLALLAACESAGDRSATGMCPQGEVCSTKTPKGLHFRGPDFADDWFADATIKRTAVGGTQTITILNAQDEQDLAFPFNASLDTTALSADAPQAAKLTLHGASAGTALLRITDASDGKLFDRVTVEATPIAQADVVAFHDEMLRASDPAPAMLVDTNVQLMARLWDSTGLHRLVDQSLVLTVTGQTSTPDTWDTVSLTPNAIGTIGVTLRAGGVQRATTISVVDGIDHVVPGWTSFDGTSNPPRANQSLVACVEAQRNGVPVVGLTYALTATGADSSAVWVASNCVSFSRATAGTVTIHGTAAGQSADLVVDVGPAMAQPYVARPDVTPGELAYSVQTNAFD